MNNVRALSSIGRASVLQAEGREFDSPRVHKQMNNSMKMLDEAQ